MRLLPHRSIHQKNHEYCPASGCGKPTKGKPYCPQHMSLSARRKLPEGLHANIRSGCCDAKCVIGEAHDSGEQYCTECKQPCNWKVKI